MILDAGGDRAAVAKHVRSTESYNYEIFLFIFSITATYSHTIPHKKYFI